MIRVQAPSIPSSFSVQLGIFLTAMLALAVTRAAHAQTVIAHLSFEVPVGHIDDCPAPATKTCKDISTPNNLGADGVRNTIPAGIAAFLRRIRHSGGPAALTTTVVTPSDYLVAEAVAGYSSLMFARRINETSPVTPIPNYVWASVTFDVVITPASSMNFTCTATPPTKDLCVDINLKTMTIPPGSATIKTYLGLYSQAQEVLDAFAATLM